MKVNAKHVVRSVLSLNYPGMRTNRLKQNPANVLLAPIVNQICLGSHLFITFDKNFGPELANALDVRRNARSYERWT
jgi:hypothetical protein